MQLSFNKRNSPSKLHSNNLGKSPSQAPTEYEISQYESTQTQNTNLLNHNREVLSDKPLLSQNEPGEQKLDKEIVEESNITTAKENDAVTLPEIAKPKVDATKLKTIDSMNEME